MRTPTLPVPVTRRLRRGLTGISTAALVSAMTATLGAPAAGAPGAPGAPGAAPVAHRSAQQAPASAQAGYGPAVLRVLAAQAAAADFDLVDRGEVAQAFNDVWAASGLLSSYTTTDPQTCEQGMRFLSTEVVSATTNFARRLAGVGELGYQPAAEETLNRFVMNELRSSGGAPAQPCGPAEADRYVGGNTGGAAMVAETLDPPVSPLVSPRWTLLNPRYEEMSLGEVDPLSAFATEDGNIVELFDTTAETDAPDFIAWPSAGLFPADMLPFTTGLWGLNSRNGNLSQATVEVSVNGTPVQVSPRARANDVVVFTFEGAGDLLEDEVAVSVSGITGGAVSSFSWTTTVFDAATAEAGWDFAEITGQEFVGGTLTFDPHADEVSPASRDSLLHDLYREGEIAPIASFAGPGPFTYETTDADAGRRLVWISSALDAQGRVAVRSNWTEPILEAGAVPVATRAPRVDGTAQVGRIVEADPGEWELANVADDASYQWLSGGVEIPGQTGRVYRAQAADLGKALSVRVTMSSDRYPTTSVVSQPSAPVVLGEALKAAGRPSVAGVLRTGRVVSVKKVRWKLPFGDLTTPDEVRYEWFAGTRRVQDGASRKYRLRSADVGKVISVKVTGIQDGYRPGSRTVEATYRVLR